MTEEKYFYGGMRKFENHSMLIRLIYANISVYFFIKLVNVWVVLSGSTIPGYDYILPYVGIPADFHIFLVRPWTIVTYMFTHFGLLHLLFNMLLLYWFGRLFSENFTEKQLLGVYVLSGIFGAVLYMAAYNIFPIFDSGYSWAIGASASVMGVVFALCTYMPNRSIYIFLFGRFPLKYIAIVTVIIDILSISGPNAGGHIAHMGGAVFGCIYVFGIKKSLDITEWPVKILYGIYNLFAFKKKGRMKSDSPFRTPTGFAEKREKEEALNRVLDKIAQTGYDSLTKKEKEILFKSGH